MCRKQLVLRARAGSGGRRDAALSVIVAAQVVSSAGDTQSLVARADVPTVAPGSDVVAGITVVPQRIRGYDYHRAAFGDAWDDDNDAPGGHNG